MVHREGRSVGARPGLDNHQLRNQIRVMDPYRVDHLYHHHPSVCPSVQWRVHHSALSTSLLLLHPYCMTPLASIKPIIHSHPPIHPPPPPPIDRSSGWVGGHSQSRNRIIGTTSSAAAAGHHECMVAMHARTNNDAMTDRPTEWMDASNYIG